MNFRTLTSAVVMKGEAACAARSAHRRPVDAARKLGRYRLKEGIGDCFETRREGIPSASMTSGVLSGIASSNVRAWASAALSLPMVP